MVGEQQLAVRDERVSIQRARKANVRQVEPARDHVIEVVSSDRSAAAEGIGLARWRHRATASARQGRRVHAFCTRPLNSSMSSSHAPSNGRSPRQKDWLRRASKSASDTPCCSTQVK